MLIKNGFPGGIISKHIRQKLTSFNTKPLFGPAKCLVYLKLPYIGSINRGFVSKITSVVSHCFYAVQPRVVLCTKTAFPAFKKDVLPTLQNSLIIYEFRCRCDADYVGRTFQRLGVRVAQHVPGYLRKIFISSGPLRNTSGPLRNTSGRPPILESSIGVHLYENKTCGQAYSDECFRILHKARNKQHLNILEAVSVLMCKPALCRQKELSHKLELFKEL